MRYIFRLILSLWLPERSVRQIKKVIFRARMRLIRFYPKLSEEKFKAILVDDLGIKSGDVIFVHSSYLSLNTDLSLADIYKIIRDVIGPNGIVAAPLFCRGSSKDYMSSNEVFDVRTTRSSSGQFSEYLKTLPGSIQTLHPTKSVILVGDIDDVDREASVGKYAFGPNTIYDFLLQRHAKVIGLGVSMRYLSFVHIWEDFYPSDFPVAVNLPKTLSKKCLDHERNEHLVETYVHDMSVVSKANPEKFARRYIDKKFWKALRHHKTSFFMIDSVELFNSIGEQASYGNTIYIK